MARKGERFGRINWREWTVSTKRASQSHKLTTFVYHVIQILWHLHTCWVESAGGGEFSLVSTISNLQRGQEALIFSHLSTHSVWKKCEQGNSLNSSLSAYLAKQMQHTWKFWRTQYGLKDRKAKKRWQQSQYKWQTSNGGCLFAAGKKRSPNQFHYLTRRWTSDESDD